MQLELQRELPRYAPQLALICLFGSVALILLCESFLARREIPGVPLIRWVSNLSLAILNQWLSLNMLPILAGHLTRAEWGNHQGMLQQMHAGFWSSWAITIVCLEFLGYCWHRLSHALPWLWRIHAVHHSDVNVDATTALRHHPLETVLSALVNAPVIFFLGPSVTVLFASSLLFVSLEAFSHGNLRPGKLDRWLKYFIVTPGFHCVHHSAEVQYTNSNFSNFFPWFDYILGTARMWTPEQQTTKPLGLEYFRNKRAAWLDHVLLEPFIPNRWRKPAVD